MKYSTIFSILLLISSGCVGSNVDMHPPYNDLLSSVLILEKDTLTLELTDFFPTMGTVDSITSRSIHAIDLSDDKSRFRIIVSEDTPCLNTLDFWKDGNKVSIIARRNNESYSSKKLYIFTTSATENEFEVSFSKQPDQILLLWQNQEIPTSSYKWNNGKLAVSVPVEATKLRRSFVRILAAVDGISSNDILVPLDHGKVLNNINAIKRSDKEAQVIYSLMIDRFSNGDPANDNSLNQPDVLKTVDFQGGDFQGIIDKIRSGYFKDLGINTIWMTPIAKNPETAWGLDTIVKTKFSAYHGYWPLNPTSINEHFGTPKKFKELLNVAHDNNLNVIVDYVANHLHQESHIVKEHPDWLTPKLTDDGRPNIRLFDEYRLTTWFDSFLPTLDMEKEEVREAMTDSALYWLENYDIDGFRHDAAKHIHESYWRLLTQKIRKNPRWNHIYQIGETYGKPSLIRSYVKAGQLDGQFDFNVYHSAVNAFGMNDGDMRELHVNLMKSLDNYGYHNLMGYISGNHDKPRFISVAGGTVSLDEDTKLAGRVRTITVGDSSAYDKLGALEAFMLTIPGVPCIYQGDEYGEPGANDPDNRRMMRFDGFNNREKSHKEKISKLINIRRSSLPLIYGDLIPLHSDKEVIAFARVYMGKTAIIACSRSASTQNIEMTIPAAIDITGLKNHFDSDFSSVAGHVKLTLPPYGFEILYN